MRSVVLWLAIACGVATAAPVEPTFRIEGDHMDVTITGGPRVPLSDMTLESERGRKVTATAVHDEPVAVAFVIHGIEIMMGNESMTEEDDPSRYLGYLGPLNTGLSALKLPTDSRVVVITYDDAARVRVPLGAPSGLSATPLGVEKDYYGKIGTQLVQGVTLGLTELRAAAPKRKVLIVIGDGNDTDNERARPQLAELAKQAEHDGIQIEALIYKSALSSDGDILGKLDVRPQTVGSADGMPAALTAVVARAADRYTASFPLIPGARMLALRVGSDRVTTFSVALAMPPPPGQSAWVQLGLGLVFIAGLGLFLRYGTA